MLDIIKNHMTHDTAVKLTLEDLSQLEELNTKGYDTYNEKLKFKHLTKEDISKSVYLDLSNFELKNMTPAELNRDIKKCYEHHIELNIYAGPIIINTLYFKRDSYYIAVFINNKEYIFKTPYLLRIIDMIDEFKQKGCV